MGKTGNGACLRSYSRREQYESIRGALALRPEIEKIVDEIMDEGSDGIWFMGVGGTLASCMQTEVWMRGKSALPVYAEHAAEFVTTGNRRFTSKSVVVMSSVSGTTKEMLAMVRRVHETGGRVFAFVDTPGTPLAEEADYVITYPKNEQLKFYMTANRMMYRNGEFAEYEDYNANMEQYLADALCDAEEASDAWAYAFAEQTCEYVKAHPEMPHYFIGSGNQWGAVYSLAMCYWEEQMWIRTKSISAQEFFHGTLEVIDRDTPVVLFLGEDEQRPLAERVQRFLPQICDRYTVIDTKQHALKGIRPAYRGSISHLVMRAVNNRIEAYMELLLDHDLNTRRYYGVMKY